MSFSTNWFSGTNPVNPFLFTMTTTKNNDTALQLKNLGNIAYNEKRYSDAIEFYNKAIKADPTNMVFWSNIASCHIVQQNYKKSVEVCKKAIVVGKVNNNEFNTVAMMEKTFKRLALSVVCSNYIEDLFEWIYVSELIPEIVNLLSSDELAIKAAKWIQKCSVMGKNIKKILLDANILEPIFSIISNEKIDSKLLILLSNIVPNVVQDYDTVEKLMQSDSNLNILLKIAERERNYPVIIANVANTIANICVLCDKEEHWKKIMDKKLIDWLITILNTDNEQNKITSLGCLCRILSSKKKIPRNRIKESGMEKMLDLLESSSSNRDLLQLIRVCKYELADHTIPMDNESFEKQLLQTLDYLYVNGSEQEKQFVENLRNDKNAMKKHLETMKDYLVGVPPPSDQLVGGVELFDE